MRNKKGISPLIATVLLIGFTIVLAALVMRWGGTLFKTTTQTTGCESLGRLQCTSTSFVFSGGSVALTGGGATGTYVVNNEGNVDIARVLFQREDTSGSKVAYTDPATLTSGSSRTSNLNFGSPLSGGCTTLRAVYATPIITYTPTDGTAPCEITCTEQQVTIRAPPATCA